MQDKLSAKNAEVHQLKSKILQVESVGTVEFPIMVAQSAFGKMVKNEGFLFDKEKHITMTTNGHES